MTIDTRTSSLARPSVDRLIDVVVTLFKLRVVMLLLLAAFGGAFIGAGGIPGGMPLLVVFLTGGLSAAGASAINQYLERDQDGRMRRTRQRPLAMGLIDRPGRILALSTALILVPVVAVLPFNAPLAFFLALGAIIYVGVYTMWLKPRTPLNIVIGGAAGSCAVLSGGAAVGAWSDWGVLALAALVFLWTPVHFWALALLYKEDYAAAGVPMLPVRTSSRQAAVWILYHAIATGLVALLMGLHPYLGLSFLLPAAVATIWLIDRSIRLVRRPERAQALALFKATNIYLGLILLMVYSATMISSIF